jgi:3-oxoacyl-(acyl-carrier-protein) reductase
LTEDNADPLSPPRIVVEHLPQMSPVGVLSGKSIEIESVKTGELLGMVALVTGGSRGIGAAVCKAFAREGADVAVNYRWNEHAANEVVSFVEGKGRRAFKIQADVSDYDEAEQMVRSVAEKFGHLDVLVNNAGILRDHRLVNMGREDWDEVIRVNLSGVFNVTKHAAKLMIEQDKGGRIINMSSIIGQSGNYGQSNYAAAKAGVMGFTKSVAKELARYRITVNAVAPGFTETELIAGLPDEVRHRLVEQVPMKRFATPAEVAELVLYLASKKAEYITGQVMTVAGGAFL